MTELTKVAAEEAIKTTNGLISRIFGPAADGLGMILSQDVKIRAVKNQIRGLKKLSEYCEREKIQMRQVNLKVLFPYLEGIALEEDFELEDMWASLMANYLDSNVNLTTTVFPQILKQLSTDDARIVKRHWTSVKFRVAQYPLIREDSIETPHEEQLSNLVRLGIIEPEWVFKSQTMAGTSPVTRRGTGYYTFTSFGSEFASSCDRTDSKSIKNNKSTTN